MEVWGGIEPVNTAVTLLGLDCWVYSKPYAASAAGGDIHYLSSCATGRITRLLIADISGHGATVAETAGILRDLMRRYVNYLDQSRFVEVLNTRFTELSSLGTFATAVIATYFSPTGHLTLCNAGHPPPLLYRAKEKTWSFLTAATNLPLGIEDSANYTQFTVKLDPDDLILCYTDSLIEAHRADGELLGMDGLLDVVQQLPVGQPADYIPALLSSITTRHGDELTGDDVTTLLCRPTGHARRLPIAQKLGAAGRFFASLASPIRSVPWPDLKIANIGGAIIPALGKLWKR